jgi:hypothetical protein
VIAPPRSFRAMSERFSVEVVPAGVGMNMDDASALGTTFHDESRVRIRAAGRGGISEHQQVDTFLHEALHAIVHVAALHQTLHLDHAEEECMVAALTPQILLLLRDNPRVVTYLTQKLP